MRWIRRARRSRCTPRNRRSPGRFAKAWRRERRVAAPIGSRQRGPPAGRRSRRNPAGPTAIGDIVEQAPLKRQRLLTKLFLSPQNQTLSTRVLCLSAPCAPCLETAPHARGSATAVARPPAVSRCSSLSSDVTGLIAWIFICRALESLIGTQVIGSSLRNCYLKFVIMYASRICVPRARTICLPSGDSAKRKIDSSEYEVIFSGRPPESFCRQMFCRSTVV
jgi:hypothetical protein